MIAKGRRKPGGSRTGNTAPALEALEPSHRGAGATRLHHAPQGDARCASSQMRPFSTRRR